MLRRVSPSFLPIQKIALFPLTHAVHSTLLLCSCHLFSSHCFSLRTPCQIYSFEPVTTFEHTHLSFKNQPNFQSSYLLLLGIIFELIQAPLSISATCLLLVYSPKAGPNLLQLQSIHQRALPSPILLFNFQNLASLPLKLF